MNGAASMPPIMEVPMTWRATAVLHVADLAHFSIQRLKARSAESGGPGAEARQAS
jgi:hypothetical protein